MVRLSSISTFSIATLGVVAASFATTAWGAAVPGRVAIEVDSLRSEQGKIGCAIFQSPTGFPKHPEEHAMAQRWVPVRSKRVGCDFDGLSPGYYAVTVLHDENGNSRMDLSFVGAPKEGYGVSNNRTYAMRAPRWQESRFEVRPGEKVHLQVKLRY